MGKRKSSKSSSSPIKTCKHEKKPQLNNLMKILRPKVYITDTCNFKTLVQQLTGNGNYPAAEAEKNSPPPPTSMYISPPTWEVPFVDAYQDFQYNDVFYQENMSSSVDVLSTSPELSLTAAAALDGEAEERQKMEIYKGLEAMLMEMDPDSSDYYDACNVDDYEMIMFHHQDQIQNQNQVPNHEVCVYDYDLSNFV